MGLEPTAFGATAQRSDHLSYTLHLKTGPTSSCKDKLRLPGLRDQADAGGPELAASPDRPGESRQSVVRLFGTLPSGPT